MQSNRTANFKDNEESVIINNNDKLYKQFTSPLPLFNIHFKYSNEEEKETSSFSFKNDLLDKKTYEFIKSKDECLAMMQLDDSIPIKNEEDSLDDKENHNNEINKKKMKI